MTSRRVRHPAADTGAPPAADSGQAQGGRLHNGFNRGVERLLGGLAWSSYQRPWPTLAVLVGLALLALLPARSLRLDADLAELLPRSFPSVQGLDELKKRFGGIGYVVVVGQGSSPEALRRFADDIAPRLAALPSIRYVDYRRPVDFFEDHALYYLQLEDLVRLQEQVAARESWERRHRNPLYVDLEESEPPPIDTKGLEDKYASGEGASWLRTQLGESYYLDPQKQMIALLAKPAGVATNFDEARRAVEEVEALLASLDTRPYGPGFHTALTGRFKKMIDQQAQINSDLATASSATLLLIVLYLMLHFRRPVAVVILTVPLLVGVAWTFGFAGAVFGSLNILTGFIGAIMLGLGIDHGIHLLGRYQDEQARCRQREEHVRTAFGRSGRAVAVAALTTLLAFAGLGFSEFRAFREFGVLAALGMLAIVAAYAAGMPALVGLAERFGLRPVPPVSPGAGSSRYARSVVRLAAPLCLVSLVLLGGLAISSRSLSFDYDFASLEDGDLPSFRLDHEVNRILGYSQTPAVVLTADEQQERAVARAIRERQEQQLAEQSTIDFVATVADLVPQQQVEKQAVLQELARTVARVKPAWLPEEERERFESLRRMVAAEPFVRADLPVEIRRQFEGSEVSSTPGSGFVLVFPRISLSDGVQVRAFARELRDLPLAQGKTLAASGDAMILADIIEMVADEAPPVLACTLVALFLVSWLLVGRLREALLALLPAAGTMLATAGLLPLAELPLNYLNIVMIPALFGLSVDGGAHLVLRWLDGAPLQQLVERTSRAVVGSLLTSCFVFCSMLTANHPGLRSLSELSLLALGVNLLLCVVVLPASLAWLDGRRRSAGAEAALLAQVPNEGGCP